MDLCNKSGIVQMLLVLKTTLKIIIVILPIIIIIMGIMDMIKAFKTGEEIKNSVISIIRRLIAALIILLLPTLLTNICKLLLQDNYDESMLYCMENATRERVVELREKEAASTSEENNDKKDNKEKVYDKEPNKPSNNNKEHQTVGNGLYFDSNDVTKISGLSETELYNVIANSTAYKGKAKVYLPLVHDLYLAEQNHNVNAFYLIGLYSYESGWLGSELTKKCNNIGGVRYYNQTYGNNKKTTNCLSNYAGFDSISEFIDFHANLLETKYLTPGGSHYNGTSVAAVAKDYGSGNGIDTIIRIATNVSTT